MILLIDIETYSTVDVRRAGVHRYVEDPEFRVMMCGWFAAESVEEFQGLTIDRVELAVGEVEIIEIPGLFDPAVVKVAHNAEFERVALSRLLGLEQGEYLSPTNWIDTQALGAERGLPRSLESMAKAVGVDPKDSAGTALVNLFSKPSRRGGVRTRPEDQPEKWAQFCDYCRQDVATTGQLLARFGREFPTVEERSVWDTDQRINDRGLLIDRSLVSMAIAADEDNRAAAMAELTGLLGVDNPNSVVQFRDGIRALGLDLPDVKAETVETHLDDEGLTEAQRRALELRAELAGSAVKKFKAIEDRVCADGRVRGGFRFFGAHTGRWSGSGVQFQNLPRAHVEDPEPYVIDLELGLGAEPDILKALVRPAILGPLVVVDFSAIEARVLAWLAGEEWALEAFRAGRDIYVETAARMGGLSRQQGKVAVLALGYQGGVGSLRVMGAEGSDDDLDLIKGQWRRANRQIVRFWSGIEEAFSDGGRVGRVRVERRGRDRWVWLPSGRAIVYRDVAFERFRIDGRVTESWRFNTPQNGGMRTHTYGGRLTENVTQAVARDLLAAALVRLDRAGFRVVGHVHDEVLVEAGLEQVEAVTACMVEAPDWAEGLPLDAEGFWTARYRKG